MKKILILLILLTNIVNSQEIKQLLPAIKIKSTRPLVYDARLQKSDTIYRAITNWDYNTYNFIAKVSDYIKINDTLSNNHGKYKQVYTNVISYDKAIIDYLFTTGNIPILITDSYCNKFDLILNYALLTDTQSTPTESGFLLYNSSLTDWILIP